jgi:hypothetical protein
MAGFDFNCFFAHFQAILQKFAQFRLTFRLFTKLPAHHKATARLRGLAIWVKEAWEP